MNTRAGIWKREIKFKTGLVEKEVEKILKGCADPSSPISQARTQREAPADAKTHPLRCPLGLVQKRP